MSGRGCAQKHTREQFAAGYLKKLPLPHWLHDTPSPLHVLPGSPNPLGGWSTGFMRPGSVP